eukprot:TRINITY_DN29220_c0_g1_i1.p1 TRINITY_DN29220_c0_g1~~TRINITY_DN29220_c0_g1_i1.p1  ORF type:complete len:154 (+),score=55.29 TRINITY_DN29220_c0_g1_i1:99-560(+)
MCIRDSQRRVRGRLLLLDAAAACSHSRMNSPAYDASLGGKDARSELVAVLTSLEAHWTILEQELEEIDLDLKHADQCIRKYGEAFVGPVEHLKKLKFEKRQKMKEIVHSMENFNANLQGGRDLVKSLEHDSQLQLGSSSHSPVASQGFRTPYR